MGAGQIGGFATLLDIDFNNAAGFLGSKIEATEGQFIVYYLSHAMMFCVGALIEAHVVLTPASCVFGERYKFDVFGGTHMFIEGHGVSRSVNHVCIHRGYNHSKRWIECSTANIALLVLNKQFSFDRYEQGADFVINRVRYGTSDSREKWVENPTCRYYGWGSRRNGYLIPLLMYLYRVDVNILPQEKCPEMWRNEDNTYLCIQQPACRSEKFGALCPDDMGSLILCSGFATGMMTSRLVDRPCGTGFLDLSKFTKFITCGVDDSRDVIHHEEYMAFEFTTSSLPSTMVVVTPPNMDLTETDTLEKKEKKKEKESQVEKKVEKLEEESGSEDKGTEEKEDFYQ